MYGGFFNTTQYLFLSSGICSKRGRGDSSLHNQFTYYFRKRLLEVNNYEGLVWFDTVLHLKKKGEVGVSYTINSLIPAKILKGVPIKNRANL